ncbi:Reticulon-4-interacting protein 1, mitochondrial [Madurella mycetomatis]|uniref:Reticulon-4-interacting protein 1, mitochondrial n=1 Tax=Madurella mycetomatis TaxID=100816 RepID=A0A175VV62_9PEZI|nr:Reticulon-4-interacting protein 1, mitochondrial [Madurella mycetomatis]
MRAARVRATSPEGTPYAFPHNPAPSSAIEIHDDIPKPQVSKPGELLIQVKASTVFRDNLEYNELYPPNHGLLGNDFAGVVVAVHESEQDFRVGDHVYGMAHVNRGGTWAEYAIVTSEEAVRKPDNLSWEEAAALPASALTADQALFVHAGLETAAQQPKRILITGASGGVGMYLVQFAVAAGHHVVAATSSKERNGPFLHSIGAHEVVEYSDFGTLDKFDLIVDSVGSQVLSDCWSVVKPDGTLMSFDSSSWGYIEEHRSKGVSKGKEGVRALYFIVKPSRVSMERISEHVLKGNVKGRVLKTVSLNDVREAYESVHSRGIGHGKIVVLP